jgi:Chlorophyll A-B binding protein
LQDDYAPGELGFDPLGLCPPDGSQEKYDMQTKELNNGRLVRSKLHSDVVNFNILGQLFDCAFHAHGAAVHSCDCHLMF